MEDFITVKEKYVELRNAERNKMNQFLKANGYTILNERGGRGCSKYTSTSKLIVSYDLSNWMWIEVEKDGMRYLISFQAFDVDSSSGNHLVLMDRLGVCKYTEYNARDAFENMIITEIDLPMDEDKLSKLLAYLQ